MVEVRYNPFDLKEVWRFENGEAVEALGVKKLLNNIAKSTAEERPDAPQKISREAANYFQRLRETQAVLTANQHKMQFSKLKSKEAAQ